MEESLKQFCLVQMACMWNSAGSFKMACMWNSAGSFKIAHMWNCVMLQRISAIFSITLLRDRQHEIFVSCDCGEMTKNVWKSRKNLLVLPGWRQAVAAVLVIHDIECVYNSTVPVAGPIRHTPFSLHLVANDYWHGRNWEHCSNKGAKLGLGLQLG